MKRLSSAFRRALYEDERNYLARTEITLLDSTVLSLTNAEIWTGGFSYEEAVSDDNEFSAIGSVIVGSAQLIINNIDETYSAYDFTHATVVLYLGMNLPEGDNTRLEELRLGTYTVDDAAYNGATIKLSLLDNLIKFDKPYNNSNLTYPATLLQIVQDACTICGVQLNTYEFPHKDYSIQNRPVDDALTFREILSYVSTVAGCFVKCNPYGQIELKWFNQLELENYAAELDGGTFNPWSGGTLYDGGTFNPWSEGDSYDGGEFTSERNIHYLTDLYSQSIGVDDVVITGVTIQVKDESDTATQDIASYTSGTTGYIIGIADNPLITKDNATEIVDWLGAQLIGLRFRKSSITQASDPSIEAGDVGIIIDRKQNIYRTLITRVGFSIDNSQTIVCGASTPARNSATKFSSQTKNYVEARKLVHKEATVRDTAMQELSERLASSSGLYTTIQSAGSGNIFYMHDKPLLADSKIVWKMTAEAWGVTNDWQGTDEATTQANKWNAGMLVNGDVIARIMNVIGINFDWGTGGTLTLGGLNNGNGQLRVLDANGNQIGSWTKDGVSIQGGEISMNNGKFNVDRNGNATAMSLTAYGSLICYESYTIT